MGRCFDGYDVEAVSIVAAMLWAWVDASTATPVEVALMVMAMLQPWADDSTAKTMML
jgi:hypothetical protein